MTRAHGPGTDAGANAADVRVEISRVKELEAGTLAAAKGLHRAAFGDRPDFIDRLFAAAADERYLSVRVGDKPVAGCLLLGAVLYTAEKILHGGYLYALCTAAAYRRRGLAHRLIEAAAAHAGDFLLTVPASRSLCDFYRRAGFSRTLPGCMPVGGLGMSPAPQGFACGSYADAQSAAARHGGVLLSEPLFSLSLAEAGAVPVTDGDAFAAVCGGRLCAAIGVTPKKPIAEKALLHSKTPLSTDGIFADLLLEV